MKMKIKEIGIRPSVAPNLADSGGAMEGSKRKTEMFLVGPYLSQGGEQAGNMKKMKTLLMAMVLVGSVGWAEDEDSDTVVNAISSGSGVNYKVGRNMYLTDKGLFYQAGKGTYVGRDGVYTRIGKDWITPHGYMTENGGDYFGGGSSAIKIGNDYVRFNEDGEGSYNYTAK